MHNQATPTELPGALYAEVKALCAEGDRLASEKSYSDAIKTYNAAWQLVPEPKSEWNASTWILGAIADAGYLGNFRQTAREALDFVMSCPDAIGNPFLHLRYGEVLFDAGDIDHSADELTRAYIGGGEEIFGQEDPKYREFLRTKLVGLS